jgi:hypothetical protein
MNRNLFNELKEGMDALKNISNVKQFETDKPYLRYSLLILGVLIASFTGTVAGVLLIGYLLK